MTSVPISGTRDWLVYSNEHQAWWRANACGYTTDILQAGRYTKEEADGHAETRSRVKGQRPPEVARHISDTPMGRVFELERDAARYRAIRSICTIQMLNTLTDWAGDTLAPGEELDEAVDAAIAAQKGVS